MLHIDGSTYGPPENMGDKLKINYQQTEQTDNGSPQLINSHFCPLQQILETKYETKSDILRDNLRSMTEVDLSPISNLVKSFYGNLAVMNHPLPDPNLPYKTTRHGL